jgi:hypothetical protein
MRGRTHLVRTLTLGLAAPITVSDLAQARLGLPERAVLTVTTCRHGASGLVWRGAFGDGCWIHVER